MWYSLVPLYFQWVIGSCLTLFKISLPFNIVLSSFLFASEVFVHTPPAVKKAPLPLVPTCKALPLTVLDLPNAHAITLEFPNAIELALATVAVEPIAVALFI